MAAFGSPPIATGTTPATLIKAVGRLKRLRESAAEATAAVNKLHAKYAGARSLPATEAERVSVVGELDAAYIAALKCAQEERSAALRCLRAHRQQPHSRLRVRLRVRLHQHEARLERKERA